LITTKAQGVNGF